MFVHINQVFISNIMGGYKNDFQKNCTTYAADMK